MIDAEEIELRLKAVQAILRDLEESGEPDVEKAAEVARLMQSLASDVKSAVLSASMTDLARDDAPEEAEA